MLSKLIFPKIKLLRRFRISVCSFCSESSTKKERNYVFREVRNNSIIRDFAFGLINPQLLRMPNPPQTDSVFNDLMSHIDNIPKNLSSSACLEQLKDLGVFGAIIPATYGGLGLSLTEYVLMLQHEILIDWVMPLTAHQNLCAQTIVLYGSEEQKSFYLPRLASGEFIGAFCLTEASSGSDMMAMETMAVLSALEDYYVVDGVKKWVVNGAVADVLVVCAVTEDSKYEGGRQHLTAMIVDRHLRGVSVSECYQVPCLPLCQLADISLDQVCVPVANILYEDHGGCKIANQVQNNARCIVGALVASSMRVLVDDLVDRYRKGQIMTHIDLVRGLVDECLCLLYAVESSLLFTTRFHDMYQVPEIEMESAAIKVFSIETAHTIADHYLRVMSLLQCPPPAQMALICDRVSYMHSFLGSNYFVRLYIGGTMEEMCTHSFADKRERMNSAVENFSFNLNVKSLSWTVEIRDPKYCLMVDATHFKEELMTIFKRLNLCRSDLHKTLFTNKEKTFDCQKIMEGLSRVAELSYVVSCCVARVNSDHGDYELACTQMMLDRTRDMLDHYMDQLILAINEESSPYEVLLLEDILSSEGFPSGNILDLQCPLEAICDTNTES